MAAVGILVVAVAVVAKIWREHTKYAENKDTQNRIAESINKDYGVDFSKDYGLDLIPAEMREPAGKGWLWSIAVVIAAALPAIGFCISVAFL